MSVPAGIMNVLVADEVVLYVGPAKRPCEEEADDAVGVGVADWKDESVFADEEMSCRIRRRSDRVMDGCRAGECDEER